MNEFNMDYSLDRKTREQMEFDELANILFGMSDYHKANFENYISENGVKRKFNGVAFLFSAYWMLFKSMFKYGALFIFAIVVLAFAIPDPFYSVICFGLQIGIGLKGNQLYYNYVRKEVESVMFAYDEQEQRIEHLEKKKKRNLIAGITLFIIFQALAVCGSLW